MRLLTFLGIILQNYAADESAFVTVFRNDSFGEAQQFPLYMQEKSEVFVEVKATSESQVAIPKECYVSGFEHRNHHPSLGYGLIREHCTFRRHSYHLPAKDRAVRFRFEIRQYFAVSNQFLYLHCTVTLCKRNDVPPSSAFRCSWRKREVVRRSCPHKQEENVVTGPFTVWPDWLKQDHRTTQVGFNKTWADGPTSLNTTRQAVQVRLFVNKAYNLEYKEFPINIESYRKVFIQVEATDNGRVAFPEECYVSKFKNRTLIPSSMRHKLIDENCDAQLDVYYLQTREKAVRFRFVIKQFFGVAMEPLYLHCNIVTCHRNDAPQPTVFNCHTHGQYCPDMRQQNITKGPFVVWPVAPKRHRDNVKLKLNTKPNFFVQTAWRSVSVQDNEYTPATDTRSGLFDCLSMLFVSVAFISVGMVLALAILCFYKVLNRVKVEQDESTNGDLV